MLSCTFLIIVNSHIAGLLKVMQWVVFSVQEIQNYQKEHFFWTVKQIL